LRTNSSSYLSPQFSLLSNDQLEQIHLASLEILDSVGVQVDEPEALELLGRGGAFVDGDRVKIPAWMVQDALASAPARVVLSNSKGERSLFLEKNRPYFGTGSDLPYTIDTYTGKKRYSTKKDVENAALVVDALPNIDFVMSMGIAADVPASVSDLRQFEAMVTCTSKPIVFTSHHRQGLLDILEMSAVIVGGKANLQQNPFLACYSEPISPLRHTIDGTQKLLTCAEWGIPVIYTPGLMAGATGPVTLAGAVAVANAELLSGLVIHQLKKRGAPFIYGGTATIMDMRTTLLSYAAPEMHLNQVVITQLGQKYNLPIFGIGGCSDSPILDEQATAEAMYTLLLAGLSGANLIHDVGYVGSGLILSLASIVINDELVSMVRRTLRSYEVNEESLALSVIAQVGPGGEFVTHEHTLRHFKEELWLPRLIERRKYEEWHDGGSRTLAERANEVVKQLLSGAEKKALPDDVCQELQKIIKFAEKRYENQ